jgi:hypothetical protein
VIVSLEILKVKFFIENQQSFDISLLTAFSYNNFH